MSSKKRSDKKQERFERLAVSRTNEVLKKLRVLGHCANRSAYSYTEDEVNKIFTAIEKQLRETKAKFYFPHDKRFKL